VYAVYAAVTKRPYSRQLPELKTLRFQTSFLHLPSNENQLLITSFTMVHFSLAVVLLASLSSAHFLLNYPPTIGFDDSLEGEGPCGSFTVDFSQDNVTDFNVGGSEIAVTSIHPQANWLFRATLGSNQNTTNWTQLIPIVQQTGLGDYCEKSIAVPASWAGQQGIISVVQDAPDGILYQVRLLRLSCRLR